MSQFDEDDPHGLIVEECSFSFELVNSEDSKTVVLICQSERELQPHEYAQALKAFADRIESIVDMSEASSGTIN